MKAWKIFLTAGALLLLTENPLTSAFTIRENDGLGKRYQTSGGPESKASSFEASEGVASRTIRKAKKDRNIQLKCAQSLDFTKNVGLECSKNEDCPDDSKCTNYTGSPTKFCLCANTHVIYHKTGKLCMDLYKPCERADELGLCHSKAKCMSAGLNKGLFYCKCNPGYSGNGATCRKIKNYKGGKNVKQVYGNLSPTRYTDSRKIMNRKPTGDNKGGELTVGELYSEAKAIVLRNKMLIAAGAVALLIIVIVIYCLCRKRKRSQMRKKMQEAFEQEHFGQYNQAMDPGYGQPQTMMAGEYYDYPPTQYDQYAAPAAPAPPAAPPPPPAPPAQVQAIRGASKNVLESKSSFLSDE